MQYAAGSVGDGFAGVVEHLLKERLVGRAEFVVRFRVQPFRKGRIALKKMAQVSAAALNEMRGKVTAVDRLVRAAQVIRQVFEIGREQREQGTERALVAAVRRGGDEHEMALRLFGELGQKLVALMSGATALGGRRARVGFIHDDEIRAGAQKIMAAAVGLDEVHGDDDERIDIEDGLVGTQIFFETTGRAGKDQLDRDIKFGGEFLLPLFGEMGRTQDAEPGDFAAIEHFARDQTGFDGFADAHVVRDEQPDRVQLQRHEERHELIRARLHGETAEGPKRAGTGAEAEAHRITQQTARNKVAEIVLSRRGEGCRSDGLQHGMDAGGFLNRSAQRPDHEEISLRFRQHDPFPPARLDESARSETHFAPPAVPRLPKTLGYWATTDAQSVA